VVLQYVLLFWLRLVENWLRNGFKNLFHYLTHPRVSLLLEMLIRDNNHSIEYHYLAGQFSIYLIPEFEEQ
jgi:hypothetical protein